MIRDSKWGRVVGGALDDIGLPHTGTFATREASATPAIADVGGFRL